MPVTSETTSQQFAAVFAAAIAGTTPANVPPLGTVELLARHRKTLQAYAAKGYSVEQIREILQHPTIGIRVGTKAVRRAMAAKAKKRKAPIKYTAVRPNGVIVTSDTVVETA